MNDTNNNRKPRPNNRKRPQSQNNKKPGSSNNKRRSGQNKNRRPKSLSPIRILQKYDNLIEQHIVARKKYFELYGRASGKQLEKVESNYEKTLRDLRSFEAGLKDWQKDVLEKKVNMYPEDRHYSSVNNIDPKGELVPFAGDFEDPHLLPTQKSENWQQDSEESAGTMEDYYQYKGIEPPTVE